MILSKKRVDFNGGLGSRGEGTLGTLTRSMGKTEGMGSEGISNKLRSDLTLLLFALEFLDEVVDKTVIGILNTKVGVTGSGLDFEDTLLQN